MKSWLLAVGLLAAAATTPAYAADLGEGQPDQYGSAYDDPRYAEMYRYPENRPVPRAPVYGDRYADRDYVEPPRYPPYGPRAYQGGACAPREAVRYRLYQQGWQDIRAAELRGELATVLARRPSGRLFELTLDRCSGEVVSARPLDGRSNGPYAYGPRRWDRPYY